MLFKKKGRKLGMGRKGVEKKVRERLEE